MNSPLRITCLVDDCAHQAGLLAEHGLSFLVERGSERVLLDTGTTDVILRNVDTMSVDLNGIDVIALSHGHYDHTNGLPYVAERIGKATVFCHPNLFEDKVVVRDNEEPIHAGPTWNRESLEAEGVEFDVSPERRIIARKTLLTGQIPRNHPEESVPSHFMRSGAFGLENDEILDDQCLAVETPRGLVVVLGCTHSGIINTLEHVLSLSESGRIHAVVGGLHLVDASLERIRWTIEKIRPYDIRYLGLCHCTGIEAYCEMSRAFPGRCRYVSAGTVIEFE